MKTNVFCFLIIVVFFLQRVNGQDKFPVWKEGEMEIHHINTGRGEQIFCIFPDGTTMLMDAGDLPPDPSNTDPLPDDSRQPGEWIARYILNLLPNPDKKKIDYFLLTHFHGDHMGTLANNPPKTKTGGDYLLSGVTEVAEYIQFSKLVDRDWPLYNYPQPLIGGLFENYKSFVNWSVRNSGMKAERFMPGVSEQFVLVNNPGKYAKLFEVRNIVSNGEVWTGIGNQTRKYFPDTFVAGQVGENNCSTGVRISYGKFDYFNGGDIYGKTPFNAPEWQNIERPVGQITGPVEVCTANHHAWIDAMSEYFLSCLQPQVIVIHVREIKHLNNVTLKNMSSKDIYAGDRDIFATNIPEISKQYVGPDINRITDGNGHIVVKVEPEGNSYHVYVLDASNESFFVKAVYGPYICN